MLNRIRDTIAVVPKSTLLRRAGVTRVLSGCVAGCLLVLSLPPVSYGAESTSALMIKATATGQTFSAKIQGAPIVEVFQELNRQTGTRFKIHGDPSTPVQAEFEHLPLQKGLQRMLHGRNHVLIGTVREPGSADAPVSSIELYLLDGTWVTKGAVKTTRTATPPPTTTRQERSSQPGDIEERIDALFDLIEEDPAQASEAVAIAARDPNLEVRRAALEALEYLEEMAPINVLTEMALEDEDPELRVEALELLAASDAESAISTLQLALKDPNEDIRQFARNMLQDLES